MEATSKVNLSNLKVSYQKDTWSDLSKELTIKDVLSEIKSDLYKSKIERLRLLISENDHESYKAEKLKLPAVTFCGTFSNQRKKENLKEYNQLIVIDIDKLSDDELKKTYKKLESERIVFSFWISPSNNGIKGLVSLNYSCEIKDIDIYHKNAFKKLSKYFFEQHNILLDNSGNDTTRLCFISYDHSLIIKDDYDQFHINETDIDIAYKGFEKSEKKNKINTTNKKNALYNPAGKNLGIKRKEIKNLILYLTKKNIPITGEYENRYKIGYAISNTFTYDLGLKYFLDLCKIDPKYNEKKAQKLLEYCYENNTGWTKFEFIEDLAKKNGYIKKTLERVVS